VPTISTGLCFEGRMCNRGRCTFEH